MNDTPPKDNADKNIDKSASGSQKTGASAANNAGQDKVSVSWPDPEALTSILSRIGERSRGLLQDYMHRNRISIPVHKGSYDPGKVTQAFVRLTEGMLSAPETFIDAQLAFWQDYVRLWQSSLSRLSGKEISQPIITPEPTDKRFRDVAWEKVWLFDFIKQSYLLTARWAQSLVRNAEGIDTKIKRKIDFYTRQMVDAVSPSNFWMTNPEVLRRTLETGGENLIKGLEHLLRDLESGRGTISINMTDSHAFQLGVNIATTPGKVVYQNELMQLIQYAPQTEKVHKTPILIIPPWINKFYILDMSPKNSFINYLVQQGHTVFCISWVNPDARHAKVRFDDYMTQGALSALREIARLTEVNAVNVVGYCIGGTLLSTTLGYLHAIGNQASANIPAIASATYLVTLMDFSEPGDIGVFIDDEQITALEEMMRRRGYLDAHILSTTFSMLRSNDLIWSFVINNYLLGKESFPFDLLYWNSDSTNLPAEMQSFYLRNMYLQNLMVKPGGILMKEVPINLYEVATPSFFLSTRDDHIAPWRSTYTGTQIFKGPRTFMLSGSGHIAGVINPPTQKKYGYWKNEELPADPDKWFEGAQAFEGSWWPAWVEWLKTYAGEMVDAREPGCGHPTIEDAPGSYVKVKAA